MKKWSAILAALGALIAVIYMAMRNEGIEPPPVGDIVPILSSTTVSPIPAAIPTFIPTPILTTPIPSISTIPTPGPTATPDDPTSALGGIKPSATLGMDQVNSNSWKSKPNWQFTGNQIVDVPFRTGAKYGQTIEEWYTVQGFLDFTVQAGGKPVANLKIHRIYPESGTYVNIYEGQSPGGQECHLYGEELTWKAGTIWAITHPSMNYSLVKKMFDGQPHKVYRAITLPSGLGKNDGHYHETLDGAVVIDLKAWQANDSAHSAIPNVVNIQVDISNHQQPSNAFFNISNVLVTVK